MVIPALKSLRKYDKYRFSTRERGDMKNVTESESVPQSFGSTGHLQAWGDILISPGENNYCVHFPDIALG